MASRTDFGPPYYKEMLPPVILENYGRWLYHEHVRPGVLKHVAESGAEIYTVRVGSPRLVSTDWIRDVCTIGGSISWKSGGPKSVRVAITSPPRGPRSSRGWRGVP